ncbi:MAG: CxxxxCH/CxxCH domain-containing protein, partial [Gammaproteobacteria bacterium]
MYFLRIPGETNAAWNGTNCTNVDCHFNNATPNWVGGSITTCDACHGYPPVNGTVDHDLSRNDGGTYLKSNHEECAICHGTKDDGTGNHSPKNANYDPATHHGDGSVMMNGPSPSTGAGYNETNFGCDNACHANDASHRLADSGRTVTYGDFGAGSCDVCHGPGGSGPTVVWPSGNATGKATA